MNLQNLHKFIFIDNRESEVAAGCAIVDGLRPDIVTTINKLLINENRYVEILNYVAKEVFEQQDSPTTNIKIVINKNKRPSGEHSRRYINSPVSDKIAVLMPNDNMSNRDVVAECLGMRHIIMRGQ